MELYRNESALRRDCLWGYLHSTGNDDVTVKLLTVPYQLDNDALKFINRERLKLCCARNALVSRSFLLCDALKCCAYARA